MRDGNGECAAAFRPRPLSNCRQERHLCYVCNGSVIARDVREEKPGLSIRGSSRCVGCPRQTFRDRGFARSPIRTATWPTLDDSVAMNHTIIVSEIPPIPPGLKMF